MGTITGTKEVDLDLIFNRRQSYREIDEGKLSEALNQLREAVDDMNRWHSQGAEALRSLGDSLTILESVASVSHGSSTGSKDRIHRNRAI